MAEDTRERSTTTWAEKPEAVEADLADANRWLYFMKGTGSDRDMRLALGVLRAWLQGHLGDTTIDGKLTVSGQNGTAELTNLLFKMATSAGDAQFSAEGVTFTDESMAGYSFAVGRTGISMTSGKLTLTLDASGEITVTQKNAQNVVTSQVSVSKFGVSVSDGTNAFKFGLDSGVMKVEGTQGSITKLTTHGLRRTYSSDSPVSYDVSSWPKQASTVRASITDSTVVRLNDGTSGVASKKFKLDWTPAEDTEVVIDYQCSDTTPLKILNKDDNLLSSDGFVLQAPNTVRRYVYKGSTTGWVCLY